MNSNKYRMNLLTSPTSIFSNNNSVEDSPMMKLFIKRRRNRSAMRRRMGKSPTSADTGKKESKRKFRTVARRVLVLNRVFQRMREYAAERGNHGQISSNAMQLKDSVQEDEKDLMFNPNDYKSRYQFSFPKWARIVCQLRPEDRTPEQLQNLAGVMRQLKDFRKYSKKMQLLLAKITRYEAFGRRRVIIRKGHLGIGFYFVFSGSVGVTVDVDEDKAFDKQGKGLVNVMRKGDSFGEIALVQKCRRSATVVCMEYTEFLVIDKQDFYLLGIDKFAEEEMLFRYNFIKSLDVFKTWQDADLKELASGGRNMEYLCDKVIEEDSTKSEFVFIITKGQAHVLRLLDLTLLQNMEWNAKRHQQQQQMRLLHNNHNNTSRSTSGNGYYSATSSQMTSPKPDYDISESELDPCTLPGYNTPHRSTSRQKASSPPVSFKLEDNKHERSKPKSNSRKKSGRKKGGYSATSLASGYYSSDDRKSPKDNWRTLRRKTIAPVFELNTCLGEGKAWQSMLAEESIRGNVGLGAYIRIDTLSQGDVFGMKYIAKEEDRHTDCMRKFTLVSAGCEIIRIPKLSVERMADDDTIAMLESVEPGYPADDKLFQIYQRYHTWRSFREKLVDDISSYQGGINKAFSKRSSDIPKIPRIGNRVYSRIQSPVEHWNMLVDTKKLVKKDSKTKWKVFPHLEDDITRSNITTTVDDVTLKLRAAPFLQDHLLTARGSQRELILTHGGDRVNKLPKVFAVK